MARAGVTVAFLLTLGACASAPTPPSACGGAQLGISASLPAEDQVSLLVVVDGSPAMDAFRATTTAGLRDLVRALASGDVDHDGTLEFQPPDLLRVAVIDTDVGTDDVDGTPACAMGLGDDGRFLVHGASATGCADTYAVPDGVFTFRAGRDDPDQLATDIACVASAIHSTCAYSRAADAIERALSRPTGLVSPDALLGVVVLTAQDDCSTDHPEIFASAPPFGDVPVGLRCSRFEGQLRSVDAIRARLLAHLTSPNHFVLGVAAGIPPSLAGMSSSVLLASPALDAHPDPAHPDQLAAACTTSDGASATPARRWAALAGTLDAHGAAVSVRSICEPDLTTLFYAPNLLIGHTFSVCLPRPLNVDADGDVPCEVLFALPPIGTTAHTEHCFALESPEAFTLDRIELATDPVDGVERRREICRLRQVGRAGAGVDPGWAYDDGSPSLAPLWSMLSPGCEQRIGMSGVLPEPGFEIRITCDERILPASHSRASRGAFCDPTTGMTTSSTPVSCSVGFAVDGDPTSAALSCDPFDRTCQLACNEDGDCGAGGLPGFVCDPRTADAFFEIVPSWIEPTAVHRFCIDPNCGH